MTAAVIPFPPSARAIANDRAAAIVTAARAVLRNPGWHSDEILSESCLALKTYGNAVDFLEAVQVERAIRLRAEQKAAEPRGTIRRALADCAGLVAVCAACVMILGWGL